MTERQRMKLYWMKISEALSGDSWLETQFTCFGEDKSDPESDLQNKGSFPTACLLVPRLNRAAWRIQEKMEARLTEVRIQISGICRPNRRACGGNIRMMGGSL